MGTEGPMVRLLPNSDLCIEIFSHVRESPQIRGWKSQITATFLVLVLVISGILVHVYVPDVECSGQDADATTKCGQAESGILQAGLGLSLFTGLILFVGEVLRCCCLLVEEMFHLRTRYSGQLSRVLHQVFLADRWRIQLYMSAGAVFTLLAILCYVYGSVWLEIRNNLDFALFLTAFYLLFVGLFRVGTSPVDVDTSLENLPFRPAEGLACGHFYGYLKLIFSTIKKSNNEDEDWESRIQNYETEQKIKVVPRMFSLIPDSCDFSKGLAAYGLTPLEEGRWMKVVIQRGGRPCTYKVIVCKLEGKSAKDDLYVMIDVPRTLVTLKDMNDNGQLLYSLSDKQLADQATSFKRALDKVIREDRDFIKQNCTTMIETICLKDTADESKWSNGELAELIRRRAK